MSQPPFGTPSPYPQPGDVLDDKYRIEKLLGEGGMGAVAKATHLLRRAPVALKFMSLAVVSLPGAVERFVNEGVAASQIDSDHVVKVFDVGRMPNGAPYLVMEFLDGADLGQILAAEGMLSPRRAVHFVLQILRALQTAHAAGIIHRDMKPSNVFVMMKDGEPDFVKLVDFGISKVRSDGDGGPSPNLTRTNSALGTPLYMSPEQARSPRDVDHRTDLYSVGAILYELLSGRTPYTSESGEFTEILYKIFTTDPEPLRNLRPDVPDGLAAVVHGALVRERDARYGSAQEMAEALAPFADERSAQVVARIRGGRGRSAMPPPRGDSMSPPGQSVTPPAPEARATREQATALTFAASDVMRAPPTDMGATREAAGGASAAMARGGRGVAIGVSAAAALLLLAGAGVLVVRARTPAATASAVPETPAQPMVAPLPPAAPTASVALEPTAAVPSAPASASSLSPLTSGARAAAPTAAPSGAAPKPTAHPSGSAPLPQNLGDLKLH